MYWHPLARADDQCGWCSTNCQILCFSDRPEVASLRWVSWYRDSSQIWHLNGASKRNTETPQLSQGTHSYLEIYSANFHLLLMFTNISGFLAYVLYLKLLSKYFLGPLFKVSGAAQFRCSVLKIKIFFGEANWLHGVSSLDDRMHFLMQRFPSTHSFVIEVLPLVLKRCWMRNIPASCLWRKRSWEHSLMQIQVADPGDNFCYNCLSPNFQWESKG